MKKMVHLVLFTLVLLGAISSSSFAANVLAVALPREISARGKAIKRGKTACGLSGLRVACQCGP